MKGLFKRIKAALIRFSDDIDRKAAEAKEEHERYLKEKEIKAAERKEAREKALKEMEARAEERKRIKAIKKFLEEELPNDFKIQFTMFWQGEGRQQIEFVRAYSEFYKTNFEDKTFNGDFTKARQKYKIILTMESFCKYWATDFSRAFYLEHENMKEKDIYDTFERATIKANYFANFLPECFGSIVTFSEMIMLDYVLYRSEAFKIIINHLLTELSEKGEVRQAAFIKETKAILDTNPKQKLSQNNYRTMMFAAERAGIIKRTKKGNSYIIQKGNEDNFIKEIIKYQDFDFSGYSADVFKWNKEEAVSGLQ